MAETGVMCGPAKTELSVRLVSRTRTGRNAALIDRQSGGLRVAPHV